MSNRNINEELKIAVIKNDLEKVRALLSDGANVNLRIGGDGGTLLQNTFSVEITRELLLHGAGVDFTNRYNETPLHTAITLGKKFEIVKELLKHGANVNASDRKGNTPLNHAVMKNNLEVIKELLEYGADINIRNWEPRRFSQDTFTPLENALGKGCAKILIKITLIKNFDRDYRKIINLTRYENYSSYSELSHYLDECVCEILQMKTDKINDHFSLYEFVVIKSINSLHACNKIADQLKITDYPIYHDVISAKVKLCLERPRLLNKMSELQMYVRSDVSNQVVKGDVILNFDSTYYIAKYLSNDDLLNFLKAFNKRDDQSLYISENLVELNQQLEMKLDEASEGNCAKRARLDSPHSEK